MARKKSPTPKHAEVEEESQDSPEGQAGRGRITKSEAVRRALADGVDQPADGVAYIRDNFGLEMGPQHFSAVKSAHLKKQGVPTVDTRFREAAPEQAASSSPGNGEVDLLAAMEAMKPLVASLGKEQVKRIVELLG
jgi:hypothetical protein